MRQFLSNKIEGKVKEKQITIESATVEPRLSEFVGNSVNSQHNR